MTDFGIIFKEEFKRNFGFFTNKGKKGILGTIINFLLIALIAAVIIVLMSSIIKTYLSVKVNGILDYNARTKEMLNIIYIVFMIAITLFSIVKMKKVLTEKKDKPILLRLPIKPQTIFIAKLTVIYILDVLLAFTLVVPTNIMFMMNTGFTVYQSLITIFIGLFISVIPFMLAALLIIPYIMIVDFFKNRYILSLILFISLIIGAYMLYLDVLSLFKTLLETGNIKFLFNMEFINGAQNIFNNAYGINKFSYIFVGEDLFVSFVVLAAICIIALFVAYTITKVLFNFTLYKAPVEVTKKFRKQKNIHSPMVALLKKEFITVFRNPANLFSYYAISLVMPLLVYGSYSLFSDLIQKSIGLNMDFELMMLLMLVFVVLTTTFCSTNITRDGVGFLKLKSLPYSPERILLSKVIFCSIVSTISMLVSFITFIFITDMSITNLIFICGIALIFAISQILFATRVDLNNARLTGSNIEIERSSNKTIAKVVMFGLILALGIGLLTISLSVILPLLGKINQTLGNTLLYIFDFISVCLIFLFTVFFYRFRLLKSYQKLVK